MGEAEGPRLIWRARSGTDCESQRSSGSRMLEVGGSGLSGIIGVRGQAEVLGGSMKRLTASRSNADESASPRQLEASERRTVQIVRASDARKDELAGIGSCREQTRGLRRRDHRSAADDRDLLREGSRPGKHLVPLPAGREEQDLARRFAQRVFSDTASTSSLSWEMASRSAGLGSVPSWMLAQAAAPPAKRALLIS